MQVLFMDAHVLETRYCSYLCILECFHLHLLHRIHCITSVQGESQLQRELKVFLGLMYACANKGDNFGRSDRIRRRPVWFLKNLLCTWLWECISLGELHLWERGKNFAWGVSALVLAPGFLVFPLCVLRDCVERYLCLWGVMFWLLIDYVEPLPLS